VEFEGEPSSGSLFGLALALFEKVADEFRILFVADVVGQPGRGAVKAILPR